MTNTTNPVQTPHQVNEAYLEWLHMEARLLRIELYPDADPQLEYTPCTVAKAFHFPSGQDWRTVAKPSTRAATVLSAVGFEVVA